MLATKALPEMEAERADLLAAHAAASGTQPIPDQFQMLTVRPRTPYCKADHLHAFERRMETLHPAFDLLHLFNVRPKTLSFKCIQSVVTVKIHPLAVRVETLVSSDKFLKEITAC